jgi:hypothetical protein
VNGDAALRSASKQGHLDVVELLLRDPRVDAAALDNAPLRRACYAGHVSVVKRLLADPRVDPTAGNHDAITTASYCAHTAVVDALLADGRVDPSVPNNRPLRATKSLQVALALAADPRVDATVIDWCKLRWKAKRDVFAALLRRGKPATEASPDAREVLEVFTDARFGECADDVKAACGHGPLWMSNDVAGLMTRFL